MDSSPKRPLAPRNRNVSQTTGLVKFNLSPQRPAAASPGSPAHTRSRSKVQSAVRSLEGSPGENAGEKAPSKLASPLRIVPTRAHHAAATPEPLGVLSRDALLQRYAAKQTQLMELEKQRQVLEFEVVEIQAQLQASVARAPENAAPKAALFSGPELKKAASTLFQPGPELKKAASTLFSPSAPFRAGPELKKRASFMLGNKFMSEVRETLDKQQNELECLTRRGTDFARGLFASLSPKKDDVSVADSSLLADNLSDHSVSSILLSDSGDSLASAIDIDDYESE